MGWTRIAVLALFLVIIFSVSAFGSHFGFDVEGVPESSQEQEQSSGGIEIDIPFLSDDVVVDLDSQNDRTGIFEYYWMVTTFQVDPDVVPEQISTVFLIMSILSVVILVSFFLPGGG